MLDPGLVYCAITPFGERGPMKDMPGSELVIQAISDACVYRSLGSPDAPPVRVGSDIASLSTGLMAFQGIMAALLHRDRTGSGQRVTVSLLGSLLSMWGALWMAHTDPDEWYGIYCDNEAGPRMYGLRTKDRDVHFSAPTLARKGAEKEFITFLRELAEELQIKELTGHPLLSEPDQDPVRVAGLLRQEVQLNTALWEKYFKTMTAEEVIERTFRGPTITVPIHNLAEVLSHAQTQTLGMISTLQLNDGQQVEVLGLPWKGSWGDVKPTPLAAVSETPSGRV